ETCPTTNKGESNHGAQEQPGSDRTNQGLHKNLLARVTARAVPNLTSGNGEQEWAHRPLDGEDQGRLRRTVGRQLGMTGRRCSGRTGDERNGRTFKRRSPEPDNNTQSLTLPHKPSTRQGPITLRLLSTTQTCRVAPPGSRGGILRTRDQD